MMRTFEEALGKLVVANNDRIHRVDVGRRNPRDLAGVAWHQQVVEQYPSIRREWDRFTEWGGRLPLIEDLILEHQGNEGPWRAGLLWAGGRPCDPIAQEFPATIAALEGVPKLRTAMWSLMEAGTSIPQHSGPNAGVLRYHLGVKCNESAALAIGEKTLTFRNGEGVLFDDTVPHAAWNRGDAERVTLFCEIERPLSGSVAIGNNVTQRLIRFDSRYRKAALRAAQWHRSLNRKADSVGA